MANYEETITLNAEDKASEVILLLNERIAELERSLQEIRDQQQGKDFVVSQEQALGVVNSVQAINDNLGLMSENLETVAAAQMGYVTQLQTAAIVNNEFISRLPDMAANISMVAGTLGAFYAVLMKYPTEFLGTLKATAVGAYNLYNALGDLKNLAAVGVAKLFYETLPTALSQTANTFERVSLKVTQFATEYLKLGTIARGLSFVGTVASIGLIAEASANASESVKNMTLTLGNLSKEFTDLDKNSYAVEAAKERYNQLEAASLRLGRTSEELLDTYKELFDTLKETSVSASTGANTLNDLQVVMDKLRASNSEVNISQQELNAAFASGDTNVTQLAKIFGATLYPALDSVAKQMNVTSDQLVAMIDSGKLGSEVVLPALAAAARDSTNNIDLMSKATKFSHEQIALLIEKGKVAETDVIPGMATALGQSSERITETSKAVNNLSTSWDFFLRQIGDLITQKGDLVAYWDDIGTAWTQFFERRDQDWDKLKASSVNALSEIGLGAAVLVNDVKAGFTVIGETIGNTLGAISTWSFSDLGDSLNEMMEKAANSITSFTTKANDMVNTLNNGEDASGRNKKTMEEMADAIKNIPLVKFSDDLEELFKKINNTTEASNAVNIIWKELLLSDPFSGKDIGVLTLAKAILEVQKNTGDAVGTIDAFSAKLADLPAEQLLKILETSQKIPEQLKAIGDTGQIAQTITSIAFQKLNLDASELLTGYSKLGKEAVQSFYIIATAANTTGEQIRQAFNESIDSVKTQKDLDSLTTLFQQLAAAGKLSADEITLGLSAIEKKQFEVTNSTNVVSRAFNELGITSSRELQHAADTAKAAFTVVEKGSTVVKNIEKSFLAWAEAEIQAAIAAERPIDPLVRQKAATLNLSNAIEKLIQDNQKLSNEMQALVEKQSRVNEIFDEARGYLDRETASKRRTLEVERDLARQKGYTYTAFRKNIEIAELELATAQKKLALDKSQEALILGQIADLRKQASAEGALTAAIYEEIKALQIKAQVAGQNTQASQENVKQAEQNVKTSKDQTAQTNENTAVTNENTGVTNENTGATAGNTEGKKEAKKEGGDLSKIIGGLIGFWREETRALSEATEALFLYKAGLSKVEKPESITGISDAADKATSEINQLKASIGLMNIQIQNSTGSVGHFMDSIQRAGESAKLAYYEQKLEAESLNATIIDIGKNGAKSFGGMDAAMSMLKRTSTTTIASFDLLNDQDLEELQSSIDNATQKLQDMENAADDAKNRLAELNAEILREKGLDAQADAMEEQIEKANKLKEIEGELQKAKLDNNRDLIQTLEEQKTKLDELYELKEKNREADARAEIEEKRRQKEDDEREEKRSKTKSSSGSGSGSGSGITNTLQLRSPAGSSVNIPGVDQSTVNRIIQILRESGMTLS